jgi:hypothetical protein
MANTNALGGSGTISYQWRRGWTNIGANSSIYNVVEADLGSTITVTVSRSDNTGTITSDPTAPVIPRLSGAPTISAERIRQEVICE